MNLDDILDVLELRASRQKLYTIYGDIIANLYQHQNKFTLRFGQAITQKSELINLPTGGIRITPTSMA